MAAALLMFLGQNSHLLYMLALMSFDIQLLVLLVIQDLDAWLLDLLEYLFLG